MAGEDFAPGIVALVAPDGAARQVADGLAFPNGMLIMPDDQTLIVAESYAKRLTAFDIATDGGLTNRRVWAELGDGVPDGICADAENAVWYADVPNKRCVRVREGGEVLQTIELDRGCFACALGGPDRATLFMIANEWNGPANMFEGRSHAGAHGSGAGARRRASVACLSAQVTMAAAVAFNREHIRESIERAGDEHWEALVRHHTDVYPDSNPTPGDVCRAEAARLNELGLGDDPNLELVESRVERVPPAVRITHVFNDRAKGARFETEPFTNYE